MKNLEYVEIIINNYHDNREALSKLKELELKTPDWVYSRKFRFYQKFGKYYAKTTRYKNI